jgi:hypothetical protein
MNIDDLKNEILKVRAPQMNTTLPSGEKCSAPEFFELIRRQDIKDEKFLLSRRIIPILIGMIGFAVVVIIAPVRTPLMFAGAVLVFLGMLLALALFFVDYHNISKERFHTSVAQFLSEKKKRLSYWKATPFKHHLILGLFLIGWIMLNIGNKPFIRASGGSAFVGLALLAIILLNVNSERRYRKRHKKEHEPLLKMIEEMEENREE